MTTYYAVLHYDGTVPPDIEAQARDVHANTERVAGVTLGPIRRDETVEREVVGRYGGQCRVYAADEIGGQAA